MRDAPSRSKTRGLHYWELVSLIASLMALNSAAIDIFIPALQDMGSSLGVVSENERQFVITAYVLGFGFTQIIYGTLSDRFGRRPVLLFGLVVYLIATVASIFAPSFAILLALRAIQGIGAAATRVVAISVVRDCFGGARMASVMSLVMMVFMAIPVIAPNIGQVVLLVGTWRDIFVVVAIFAFAVTIWSMLRLPETLDPKDRRDLTAARTIEAFRIVLTNRRAFGYAVATSLTFGVLFGFINQAQQIYTGIYGIGATFTIYFSAGAIFMSLASFLNSRLVETLGMRRLSHGALFAFLAISVIHFLITLACGGASPFWVFLPTTILSFCLFGFVGTNFNALAMDPLGHVAGTASSVLGFLQTFVGGLLGAVLGYLYNGTLLPLFGGFIVLSLASIGCVLIAERGRLFQRLNQHKAADPVDALREPVEIGE